MTIEREIVDVLKRIADRLDDISNSLGDTSLLGDISSNIERLADGFNEIIGETTERNQKVSFIRKSDCERYQGE